MLARVKTSADWECCTDEPGYIVLLSLLPLLLLFLLGVSACTVARLVVAAAAFTGQVAAAVTGLSLLWRLI